MEKSVVNFDKYPKLNSSVNSKKDYRLYYDKTLKDLVYNTFKKDFDRFGYSY